MAYTNHPESDPNLNGCILSAFGILILAGVVLYFVGRAFIHLFNL